MPGFYKGLPGFYFRASGGSGENFLWHNYISHFKLEIRDSQNLAKLGHGCTTKLIDGGRERIEFRFNWRCGWVATMVPNCELRSTFWFPVVSM